MRRNLLSAVRLPLATHISCGGANGALCTAAVGFSRSTKGKTSGQACGTGDGKPAVGASTAATVKSATFFSHPHSLNAVNNPSTSAGQHDAQQQHADECSATQARKRAPSATTGQASESESTVSGDAQEQQQPLEATIGIKLIADDELASAFNRFSNSVGGCTDKELLQGAQQAYYSVAAVTKLLADHATPIPGALKFESAKVLAAAEEARKLIDSELLPEKEWSRRAVKVPQAEEPVARATSGDETSSFSQHSAVQKVIDGIVSLLPLSTHLAETLFNIWCRQKEKRGNLFSIAGPSDYVIDTKLFMFTRLDNTKLYFTDSTVLHGDFDVIFSNDYLRQKQPFVRDDADGKMVEKTISFAADGKSIVRFSSNPAAATDADTFVNSVDKVRRKTWRGYVKNENDDADPKTVTPEVTKAAHAQEHKMDGEGSTTSNGEGGAGDSAATAAPTKVSHADDEVDPNAVGALCIKLNGNELPPIPLSAQACVLLTMDVVVPPERYASNFEWYYNRIVGYESEYERIAAARLFAQNTPRAVASFFDFVTRMFTGKPVEFAFTKAIGRMIGLPDNVAACPPATRKLVCMYMDPAKRWILSDLIPLNPVNTTQLPVASK